MVSRGGQLRPIKKWYFPIVACPLYDNFKISPSTCSSKCHKYDNYDEATYTVSPYPHSPRKTFFFKLFTWPEGQTNSPSLPRHNSKHLSKCTFSKSLTHKQANLKEPYNHDMKVHVTTEDIKKDD